MTRLGDTRITGQSNMAPSNGTTTEAKTEDRQAPFEAEKPLFEGDTSGLGGGEDEASEMEGFGWDRRTRIGGSQIRYRPQPTGGLLNSASARRQGRSHLPSFFTSSISRSESLRRSHLPSASFNSGPT